MKKSVLLLLLCIIVCATITVPSFAASSTELESYIEGAFNARRTNESLGETILGSTKFTDTETAGSSSASSTKTDWMAFAMARYSTVYSDGTIVFKFDDKGGYADYLSALKAYINNAYNNNGGMISNVKATEWHRAILAITALGGNPENVGTYNGKPINLIADGSYNCVVKSGPARQGINGVIFALISKNIKDFTQPSEVLYSDEYFITYILKQQLADGANGSYGGWSLNGSVSDPDITAMAIQALSRYYSSSKSYTYTNAKTDTELTKTVRQAVDEALAKLSSLQLADGDYSSWGTVNVESTAQVMVALTELGIDPLTDSRFIKNGNTLLDGILKYRLSDGGFSHSFQEDKSNPYAQAGEYNYMATDQACYALVAYWRLTNGLNSLYNCRADENVSIQDETQDTVTETTTAAAETTAYATTSVTQVQTTSVTQVQTTTDDKDDAIIETSSTEVISEVPDTGDSSYLSIAMIVFFVACVTVAVTTKRKKDY